MRNRAATEGKLIEAVGRVLAREGFRRLGVRAVAREAGVDKVLIYRYFDGLEGLVHAFGESANFWPGAEEILGPDPQELLALPPGERAGEALVRFARALRDRPLSLEILAWEQVEPTKLSALLAAQREAQFELLLSSLGHVEAQSRAVPVLALLGGAINYLAVRSRSTLRFAGVEIGAESGWAQLEGALREIAARCL